MLSEIQSCAFEEREAEAEEMQSPTLGSIIRQEIVTVQADEEEEKEKFFFQNKQQQIATKDSVKVLEKQSWRYKEISPRMGTEKREMTVYKGKEIFKSQEKRIDFIQEANARSFIEEFHSIVE